MSVMVAPFSAVVFRVRPDAKFGARVDVPTSGDGHREDILERSPS